MNYDQTKAYGDSYRVNRQIALVSYSRRGIIRLWKRS